MTIDERLEKLTERHEALAQSLGLLSIDIRKTEENIAKVSKTVDILAQSVFDLVGIVRGHERRIVGLEDQS